MLKAELMSRRRRVAGASPHVWSKAELAGVISKEELADVVTGDVVSYSDFECEYTNVFRLCGRRNTQTVSFVMYCEP